MTQAPTAQQMIARYIELRDYVSAQDWEFQERMKPYKEGMQALENMLLSEINKLGPDAQNIKTDAGTAYKATSMSVRTADRNALFRYVQENRAFDMLTANVSKDAVKEYIDANNSPPPGVDVTFVTNIRIRKG